MDLVDSSTTTTPTEEHLCYVRCTYCNTVLAVAGMNAANLDLRVGVPSKRMMDTLTVKCGHCNHLSFLSPRPMVVQPLFSPAAGHPTSPQGPCIDFLKGQPSPSSSSSSGEQMTQKPTFVMKPPEKKHRTPSAYNRFMKEEIQRIKAAKPDIPHREAFSMAAKNWAKCDPRCSKIVSTSDPIRDVENPP